MITTPPQFLKELAYERMRQLRSQAYRPQRGSPWRFWRSASRSTARTLGTWLGSRRRSARTRPVTAAVSPMSSQPVGPKPVGGKQPGGQAVAVRRPMGCSV